RPLQPPENALKAAPTTKPGTVSQLGIRRLRQSVHPATIDNRIAPASRGGFKGIPPRASARLSRPESKNDPFDDGLKRSRDWDRSEALSPLAPANQPLARIFTQPGGQVNEPARPWVSCVFLRLRLCFKNRKYEDQEGKKGPDQLGS